jgi:hypothetical protein
MELAICFGAAVFVFLAVELKKWIEGIVRLKKEK